MQIKYETTNETQLGGGHGEFRILSNIIIISQRCKTEEDTFSKLIIAFDDGLTD